MRKIEREGFELRKGGVLVFHRWVYDHDAGTGEYVEEDVTDDVTHWTNNRGRECILAADVTLNDIFAFVARNPEVCDLVFPNCFASEYVKTWKKIDQSKIVFNPTRSFDAEERNIEFLELYWAPDLFTFAGVTDISGLDRPNFHGKGFEFLEDVNDDDAFIHYKKGDRVQWGLDFCELKDLVGLPIQLDTEFKILKEWSKADAGKMLDAILCCARPYSLQNIIEGILWELSFYGSEEDKAETKEHILGIKAEIDAGTATLVELNLDDLDNEPR